MSAKQRSRPKHEFLEEGPEAECVRCGGRRKIVARHGRFLRCRASALDAELMTLSPEERFAERLVESGRASAERESFIRKPKP
jgi:hypothetical protein